MDPNTSIPQGENNPPQPSEQIPQSLVTEPITPKETFVPPVQIQDNSDVPSTPVAPQTPTMPNSPEPAKKSSPILIVAIILMLIAVLAAGGYLLWLKYFSGSGTTPTPTPIAVVTTSPTPDPTANWKTFIISLVNLTFRYPPNTNADEVKVLSEFELTGDKEYIVGYEASDVLPLTVTLYKSSKNPDDWWTSEGRNKYDTFADSWKSNNPPYDVNLTYKTEDITVANHEGLKVIISSSFPVPHLQETNYLIILQNNGYVITAAYYESEEGSLALSEQILSTFKFIEAAPTASSASSPSATAKP